MAGMGMHVMVSGASGMIGRSLVPALRAAGHRVTVLSRRAGGTDSRVWDPERGEIDLAGLAALDAVVHLAGENVAGGRWTEDRRRRISRSRTDGTRLLAGAVARLTPPPVAFVSASGISAYRADGQLHDESSALDPDTFLGRVVRDWEAAAEPARVAGMRVAYLRLGVVLSPDGGALAKVLPIFRMGMGGPVGDGRMGFSWIALDDVVALFLRACADDRMRGAINAVAPGMVSYGEFARTLGRVLGRPTVVPVPARVLRAMFGQMAEETLLADLRVKPGKLESLGYRFLYPELEPALRHLLGRPA
jgi:hypothetical protein